MNNLFRSKLFYIFTSLLVVVVAAVSIMKIVSARTHDRSNPRSRPNSYLMSYTVEVDWPVEQVFDFITYEKQNVWHLIADEHEGQEFQIINADGLIEGAIILCDEFADGEGTSHQYVVKEVIPNQLIYFASEPSLVYMENSAGEMRQVSWANSYVYYDLEPLAAEKTKLTQTIVIQMPNFAMKFLTDVMGGEEGRVTWETHLAEELNGLVAFMTGESKPADRG